ncbi:MAG: sulfotransferase [Desulfatitalea sp.]|nr:sulfotransferase [Desulfatitalea sp.]
MTFNFKGLLRFIRLWLADQGWTARRGVILIAFAVCFPVIQSVIWFGFLLDRIRFKDHIREPVPMPVFIIGNPRSGTTFLHRLLAKDEMRFTTMQMWEILLCPSITQRKVLHDLAAAVRRLSLWFQRRLGRVEAGWQDKNVMHHVSFMQPEEDDYLLLHIWSALTTGLSAGLLSEAIAYTYFDTALPGRDRHRIMAFYRRCVQRHLYARRHLQGRRALHYLAKNPALSPKLKTVFAHFPDAKIIYLVRNPLEVVPSYVSMMRFSWRILGIPVDDRRLQAYLVAMARHWYLYPLEVLARRPETDYVIVRYDDLVRDPGKTMRAIHHHFGFSMGAHFADQLSAETGRAKSYRSRHDYHLTDLGLSRELILDRFHEIFERFDFDRSLS